MSLKQLIKRKMPATFNAAEYETERILDILRQNNKEIMAQFNNQNQQIEELIERQATIITSLEQKSKKLAQVFLSSEQNLKNEVDGLNTVIKLQLNSIEKKMLNFEEKQIFYYCPHEVDFVKNHGFYEYREKADYAERYCDLIRNLDEESMYIVNQILCRHLMIKNRAQERIDLFTEKEKNAISSHKDNFYSVMPQLRDNLFAYGDKLFPYPKVGMGWIETTVFLDKCGFSKVEQPDFIKNKCILDLGAFVGDSAMVFSTLTKDKVYAFEATKMNYQLMCKTLELNQIENVVPVLSAVGGDEGNVMVPSGLSMGNQIIMDPENVDNLEEVKMISVDQFVTDNNLKVGMIKTDVEGFEQQVLKGARETICTQKPILLFSIYHTAQDFFEIKPIIESWNLGYRFRISKEMNEHIHFDTMLIAEVIN